MGTIETAKSGQHAWFRIEDQLRPARLVLGGRWTVSDAARLDVQLLALNPGAAADMAIDGSQITQLDSAGAWLIVRTKRILEDNGKNIREFIMPALYVSLVDSLDQEHKAPPVEMPDRHSFVARLARMGKATIHAGQQSYKMLEFLGRVTIETGEAIYSPRRYLRVAALVHQIEETGISAMPIVGLLAFLIGIVLAYQGADQLKRFGAEVFTINLLGVGILREIGGLITAIIVAGRSGSAFTAQIGTMQVNEEIDAMQTIGLNTVDALVLPRVIGLVIALPILTFFADIMGMLGGAVMCYFDLGISVPVFLRQLQEAVTVNTFMVGLIKAPIYAFVIALVGCYEGFQVERNAASVGQLTTRSVVESVFLVIVLDAGFSIIFSVIGI